MDVLLTISFWKLIIFMTHSTIFWKIVTFIVKSAIYIIPLTCAVLSLLDFFKRDFKNNQASGMVLLLMIILSPIIGSIIYISLKNNHNLKTNV